MSNKPITLIGIPYFMSGIEIFSEDLGLILPIKKPIRIKGIIFINNLVIFLSMCKIFEFYTETIIKKVKCSQ